jgi:hypothetical protein
LLAPRDPGDLYFDMEGDPLYDQGLEYLFGIWGALGEDGAGAGLVAFISRINRQLIFLCTGMTQICRRSIFIWYSVHFDEADPVER